MIVERRKWLDYTSMAGNLYFWRLHTGAEIDLVEEQGGRLHGFEYKWGKQHARIPQTFLETYPEATFTVITPENFLEHVGARKETEDSRKN